VEEALVGLDPGGETGYRERAAAYRDTLAALEAWVRGRVAELPAPRRILVTAHDAFGYFGRAYGFEVVGLQGISTVTEAGTADVQRIADLVVDRGIPAIFIETSVSQRTIEAVQAAVRARGEDVRVGGSLFSDAMGTAGTPEGTYPGMVRHNVNTIVDALRSGEEAE
jgi:manganese/zinc/iron transport system substrate-binding protein